MTGTAEREGGKPTVVALFGGTGFLGRRMALAFQERDLEVRIAARRPDRLVLPQKGPSTFRRHVADLRDARSLEAALEGAEVAVNAVSLYLEEGELTFDAIHVEGARRLARLAQRQGCKRLLHISGLGSDPASRSAYVRARGLGEEAVRAEFPDAIVFRPSVMFGQDDAFLSTLLSLVSRLPAVPLFGRGRTRLQPVFVDDVASAAVAAIMDRAEPQPLYELGGPEIYRYRELLEIVMAAAGKRPLIVPCPFWAWEGLAALSGLLPSPPLTEGQVALMRHDNIAATALPGLPDLGIQPTNLREILAQRFGAS